MPVKIVLLAVASVALELLISAIQSGVFLHPKDRSRPDPRRARQGAGGHPPLNYAALVKTVTLSPGSPIWNATLPVEDDDLSN